MPQPNPELLLLYQLCAPVLTGQEILWEILLNPENGDIIKHVPPAKDSPEGIPRHEILGRIQTPAEAAAGGLKPEQLRARAEALFRHRFDAGPHPRPAWFREILYAEGWEPEAPAPGQPRLTPQICQAYGLPPTLPRNPFNPGFPPALALSRLLADYDHVWAIYAPDPHNPALWQASRLRRNRPEFTNLIRLPGLTPLPPGDPQAARSQQRRLWKNLKIQGHNKASARRYRESQVRAALGLHPAWGQIGPFKHAGSAHSNWFRKAQRDAARAAAKKTRDTQPGSPPEPECPPLLDNSRQPAA